MNIINVNTIIKWLAEPSPDNLERILWISESGEQCVSIRLFDKKALPVWQNLLEIEESITNNHATKSLLDPFAALASPPTDFLSKHQDSRDRAWDIIKGIINREPDIYDEKERGYLIRDIAIKLHIHKMTVYKYLRRYWQGGKTLNALLPAYNKCGAPGQPRSVSESTRKRGRPTISSRQTSESSGVNISDDMKKIFKFALDNYFNNSKAPNFNKVYKEMISNHFYKEIRIVDGKRVPIMPPKSELPTLGQFTYWASKILNIEKSLIARKGERGFLLNHRAILGNSTQMALGPGSIYQIDATIADVYLVNRMNRDLIIGRPIVYVVIDVFSRMIAGLFVGLEGPSWLGAMMAAANAFSSKVEYCANYGITITQEEWPCQCLPEKIIADRGEFIGSHSDTLVESLNISIDNTPPYRADWKGIVEQYFRCLNLGSIKWLPGAVRKRERGEPDCRLDAQLDIEQFTRILIYNVMKHNAHHWMEWYPCSKEIIAENISPIPVDLWNWGISNRMGRLREASPERIMLALMPRGVARITAQGIVFQGMHYTCERAMRENWFVYARSKGRWSLQASYDPRKIEVIYLHLEQGAIEHCHLLDKDRRFAGSTYEDILDWLYCNKIKKEGHGSREVQSQADFDFKVQDVLAESADMKKQTPKTATSKRSRLSSIENNRREEKSALRSEDAWQLLGEEPPADQPDTATKEPPESAVPSSKTPLSKKVTYLNLLKQQRASKEEDP